MKELYTLEGISQILENMYTLVCQNKSFCLFSSHSQYQVRKNKIRHKKLTFSFGDTAGQNHR